MVFVQRERRNGNTEEREKNPYFGILKGGEKMSKPSKRRYIMSVDLPGIMYMDLCKVSSRLNCKKSDLVRWALADYLDFFGKAAVTAENRENGITQYNTYMEEHANGIER